MVVAIKKEPLISHSNKSGSIVAVERLTKQYPDKPQAAVSDVCFTLRSGEILALIGPNGAGKTTTIKMVLGLITPTSGRSTVHGYDMAVERERRLGAQHVGAVLEGARNVYWRLSPRANLHYFGALRGLSRRALQRRTDELLALLGLMSEADREVRFFSRGMQQKVAIAAALLSDPDVLLLDEPTLGLDVQVAKSLEQTIVTLARQGKAILLTTHMMGLAQRLSHRTFVISEGRQVAYDDTAVLLEKHHVRTTVEMRIQGTLPPPLMQQVQQRFPAITPAQQNGTAVLTWPQAAQRDVAQLFTLLDGAGCTVLSVQRREATLEEVFLSLIA